MSTREMGRPCFVWAGGAVLLFLAVLVVATVGGLADLPAVTPLEAVARQGAEPSLEDRHGLPLNRTYQGRFNAHDLVGLPDVPAMLVSAFLTAEDSRFFRHHGVDWLARFHALWQNLKGWRTIRGASTISEQVVRILFPRPRTYWSRWLEGWDARRLEGRFTKHDILEFYLNQVPFAAQRRGIVQAARHYFGRSLSTLNTKEMLALAAMVRAPSLLAPGKGEAGLERRIATLAAAMRQQGLLSPSAAQEAMAGRLIVKQGQLPVAAPHFLAFVRERLAEGGGAGAAVRTTLDAELQLAAQGLLDQRLEDIADSGIVNGAVLVVDYRTAEVLIWAVAGEASEEVPGHGYDAVRTPRQPGSTLKPFVYALALDSGWRPSTPIKDEPMVEAVEHGLHVYRNFSQVYYGMVPLAEALGNSLNTPAVRTLDFVGLERFLDALRQLGMQSLSQGADTYGKGLVLGNAEVSLLELVQAYGALARGGTPMTVKVLAEEEVIMEDGGRRVFSERAASTIGAILSESEFRRLEFGEHSVLDFFVRTAVKTGTSTEGNDVWAVAYDGRYVVGAWFGNMSRSSPAGKITGAGGPALLTRSVFAELRKRYGPNPLPRVALDLLPSEGASPTANEPIRMVVPAEAMEVLFDPRIPAASQRIPFSLAGVTAQDEVEWNVDGKWYRTPGHEKLMWPVAIGTHQVLARVKREPDLTVDLPLRTFTVK